VTPRPPARLVQRVSRNDARGPVRRMIRPAPVCRRAPA
jgi:hypothetical protein